MTMLLPGPCSRNSGTRRRRHLSTTRRTGRLPTCLTSQRATTRAPVLGSHPKRVGTACSPAAPYDLLECDCSQLSSGRCSWCCSSWAIRPVRRPRTTARCSHPASPRRSRPFALRQGGHGQNAGRTVQSPCLCVGSDRTILLSCPCSLPCRDRQRHMNASIEIQRENACNDGRSMRPSISTTYHTP